MSRGDWRWIRTEATQRGLSLPQLASYLDVTPQAVNYWVNNRNDPDFLNLLKLAHIFCDGSLEKLAHKAGIDLRALRQDLRLQAEALGIEPPLSITNGPVEPLLLPPPLAAPSSPTALAERFRAAYTSATDLMKYTSRFAELQAVASRLLQELPDGDAPFKARLYFDLGYAALMLGRYLEGMHLAAQARGLLSSQKAPLLLADTHWLAGECLRIIGELHEARRQCEASGQIHQRLRARASAHEPGPMWVAWNLGCIEAASGHYEAALAHFVHLGRMAAGARLPEASVLALWGRAYVAEMRGEFEKARRGYRRAKQFAERAGDRFWAAEALWRMAEVSRKVSRFQEALAQAQAAQRVYDALGHETMPAKLACTIAACHRQSHLKGIAHTVKHLLQAAHPRHQGQRGPHQHPLVPPPTRAQLQVGREALGTVEADIRQDKRPPVMGRDQGQEGWGVNMGGVPGPAHDFTSVVDPPAQLHPDDPAPVALALLADLLGTAPLTDRMDERAAVASDDGEEGGVGPEGVTPP